MKYSLAAYFLHTIALFLSCMLFELIFLMSILIILLIQRINQFPIQSILHPLIHHILAQLFLNTHILSTLFLPILFHHLFKLLLLQRFLVLFRHLMNRNNRQIPSKFLLKFLIFTTRSIQPFILLLLIYILLTLHHLRILINPLQRQLLNQLLQKPILLPPTRTLLLPMTHQTPLRILSLLTIIIS